MSTEQQKTGVIFREVQNLHNNIFWIFVLYPAFLLWYIQVQRYVLVKPSGVQNVPDLYLNILWFVFGVFFPFMLYYTKHITEVRMDGIYIRFVPLNFSFKKIPYYIVEECKIQAYESFKGGEADKSKTPQQKVSPVVILKLISGEKMLISSRKPDELCRAIQQAAAQY
ncbi:MAG: DUF6141 family protein [Methanosarcinaceae archaeon]|nr:DUF6141 family protein [Methanosarcina sp. MTP4]